MWVWQSQAPAGTSKFTRGDGCDAVGKAVRFCMSFRQQWKRAERCVAKHHFTPCFLFSSEYRITRFMAHACATDAGVVPATVQVPLQHGIGSGTIAVRSQEG